MPAPGQPAGMEIIGLFMDYHKARCALVETIAEKSLPGGRCDIFARNCSCEDCRAWSVQKKKECDAAAVADRAERQRLENLQNAAKPGLEQEEAQAAYDKYDKMQHKAYDDFANPLLWGDEGDHHEGLCWAALLAGDPRAELYYCSRFWRRKLKSDGSGGLRYYNEVCEGDIIEEALMQLKTIT